MAVLHKKEEKIQAVLGTLPKKYTHEQFVEMFIKLYSKDWGKIKSAYIKQSQDKEPGTVINMPKPEVYLKQILASYLQNVDTPKFVETPLEEVTVTALPKTKLNKPKIVVNKKIEVAEEVVIEPKKTKVSAKKKSIVEKTIEVKKPKVATKKTASGEKPKSTIKKTAEKK